MITIRRRATIGGLAATLAAIANKKTSASPASAAGLQTVRFGSGINAGGPLVIQLLIGEGLGYNKQEGFTLQPLWVGTTSNVIVGLANGSIDVGTTSFPFILPLYIKNQLPPLLAYFETTYPYKWDVVVPPDSPIKSYADLKGKKIGVSGLGSTEYPVTRAVLAGLGMNSDKDVGAWIAVGEGLPAGIALQRGMIDALAYFDTGFGQLDYAGIKFRYLPRPADLPMIGGAFLTATKTFLDKNRNLAVGYARSIRKATEFALVNPRAAAKVLLDMYPDLKVRGADLNTSINAVLAPVTKRTPLWHPPYPDTKIGTIVEAETQREAQFLNMKVPDTKPLYTNDLIDEINNFDVAAVQAQAKNFPV
jgi:NitT/TauT family transport system substrate-binding protein